MMKLKKIAAVMTLVTALGGLGGVVSAGSTGTTVMDIVDTTYNEVEMVTADGFGTLPVGRPAAQAKLMARRAAVVDGQRNLLETIYHLSVDSNTTVENSVLTSDVIQTKVSGILSGARVVSEEFDGGIYHVVMAVPKYGAGSVADVVYRDVLKSTSAEPMDTPSADYEEDTTDVTSSTGYTGLIINAKGLPLERTFCPGIFDTNGRAIYGVRNVDPDYAVAHGVAAYAEGEEAWTDAEIGNGRAGTNPLIIQAVGLRERTKHQCDVVVSVEDGDRILAENQKSGFGARYAVVLEY